ncbi:sensor histidine kinase [Nonlabens ulvanivorans]|uniref:sensor histidine kinase n=1 Tax=Nonlabens ulvanivorans TaxID=906888 RepID=UPI002942425E|nr:ATP-binding protein [Nonlabens ulvanivorans]WOI23330.1 histidine kinase [Nonlabens ulvanivorans]
MPVILQISNTSINYIAIGLMIFIILFSIGMVIFFLLSRKRITEADLEVRDTQIKAQKDVMSATLVTQEKERQRIARDLHDEISAKLNVIAMNTNMLKEESLSIEEREMLISRIETATGKTLENARKIAHNLLPPVLEKFGLCAALTEVVKSIKGDKIDIYFSCDWNEEQLNPDSQLHVYRVIQELLNNTIKYAQSDKVSIVLHEEDHYRLITYSDNGIGFQDNAQIGLGTSNISSRVDLLNGTYHLETSDGNGVIYTFKYPKT